MDRLKALLRQILPFQTDEAVSNVVIENTHKTPVIILLGAPGAGKGTLARDIKATLGVPTISTGDEIRKEIRNETEMGKAIKDIVSQGGLVGDEMITALLKNRLQQPDCRGGVILDGYPRTIAQAQKLEEFANVTIALEVYLPYDIIVKLITGRRCCPKCNDVYNVASIDQNNYKFEGYHAQQDGICDSCKSTLISRADDTEEVILSRLALYDRESPSIINYYKDKSIYIRYLVNRGKDDPQEVLKIIKSQTHAFK